MATLPLDTLRTSRRLREAGFSEPQAEVVAFLVAEAREENGRIAVTRPELKAELAEFKTDFADIRTDFAEMRTEFAKFKAEVREEIRPIKADVLVLKWMVGFLLAICLAILGKLLFG